MYEQFYGLRRSPFSLLPDPDFLFLSRQHVMALTLLKYSIMNQHAFTVITGEVGSGKSTLLNRLLHEIGDGYTVGLINFTDTRIVQFWPWILQAYGLSYKKKKTIAMYDTFLDFVCEEYAEGRRVILVVDEAQNLTQKALENLRMLSNINAQETLLQLVLVGQPEFRDTLKRPDFRQLNQRVSVIYRLDALSVAETRNYINHRLAVAGGDGSIFPDSVVALIWQESGGIARNINTLCDLSLVYGFSSGKAVIDEETFNDMMADRRDFGVASDPMEAGAQVPGTDTSAIPELGEEDILDDKAASERAAALKIVPR
jgi:general secretion pathway protein A